MGDLLGYAHKCLITADMNGKEAPWWCRGRAHAERKASCWHMFPVSVPPTTTRTGPYSSRESPLPCNTSAGIARKLSLLVSRAPEIGRILYMSIDAKLDAWAKQRDADKEAERLEEAEQERKALEAKRWQHPAALGPEYRDKDITDQARAFVYGQLPQRLARGFCLGVACGGTISLVPQAARLIAKHGRMKVIGGCASSGTLLGLLGDLTVRSGYERAFEAAHEKPFRQTPWWLTVSKPYIVIAGTLGGYPASAWFFNHYSAGATAARSERSATPLRVWPWVELLVDKEELARRRNLEQKIRDAATKAAASQKEMEGECVAVSIGESPRFRGYISVDEEAVETATERHLLEVSQGTDGVWSEEQLGEFLFSVGLVQVLLVGMCAASAGAHLFGNLRAHPFMWVPSA